MVKTKQKVIIFHNIKFVSNTNFFHLAYSFETRDLAYSVETRDLGCIMFIVDLHIFFKFRIFPYPCQGLVFKGNNIDVISSSTSFKE